MKKEKYCSVFMTTLMISIPMGGVIALLIEIFSDSGVYQILTDLGSFIAGVIGFVGIFILVWNQNKTTTFIIRSQDLEKSYNILNQISSNLHKMVVLNKKIISNVSELEQLHISNNEKISALKVMFKRMKCDGVVDVNYYSAYIVGFFWMMQAEIGVDESLDCEDKKSDVISNSMSYLNNLYKQIHNGRAKELVQDCIDFGNNHSASHLCFYEWMDMMRSAEMSLMIEIFDLREKLTNHLDLSEIDI